MTAGSENIKYTLILSKGIFQQPGSAGSHHPPSMNRGKCSVWTYCCLEISVKTRFASEAYFGRRPFPWRDSTLPLPCRNCPAYIGSFPDGTGLQHLVGQLGFTPFQILQCPFEVALPVEDPTESIGDIGIVRGSCLAVFASSKALA